MKWTPSEGSLSSLLEGDLDSRRDIIDAWTVDFHSRFHQHEWRRALVWGAVALVLLIGVILLRQYLPNRPVSRRSMDVFIGASVALPALWLAAVAAWQKRVSRWPRARCRIVYHSLQLVLDDGRKGFFPVVLYVFQVNGRTYGGDSVHLTGPVLETHAAWQLAAGYDPGTWHECSYNPRDPSCSVLDASLRVKYEALATALGAIIGLLWIVVFRSWLFVG